MILNRQNNLLRNLFSPALQRKIRGSPAENERLALRSAGWQRRVPPIVACLFLTLGVSFFSVRMRGQTPVPVTRRADVLGISNASCNTKYVIDAGDVLDVYVVDVPQFSREYRVALDGTITIPLLSSPVTAAGLTLSQLSGVISDKLRAAQLVSHPHIVVSVKSSRAHAVAISGAVQTPQIYPILGPTTLLDVLSQAGGLTSDAGSTAIITRAHEATPGSGPKKDSGSSPERGVVKVDLQKLLATGDPSLNVTVYPGDKVTVQRAGVVYVVGAVQRPGGFPMSNGRDKMTVLQAVALGEGLRSTALQKKAMIIRRGGLFPDGREEIPVNLKNILSDRAPDPGLEANDILFIPDSTSKKALRRGVEAALQMATGVVIWGRY